MPRASIVVGTYYMLARSHLPHAPASDYYSNLVISCHPGTDAVWHGAALELVRVALVRFLLHLNTVSLGSCVMTCEWAMVVAKSITYFPLR